MSFLTEWITSIVIFVLIAMVMDMLLPSSSMRKYAKMVVGLLLIMVLISPIFKLISIDLEEVLASIDSYEFVDSENMKSLIENKKKEIQSTHSAYILEEMAVQLKNIGEEELINRYNYEIKHLEVSLKTLDNPDIPKDLETISVILVENEGTESVIETVKKVDIDTTKSLSVAPDVIRDIQSYLANVWGVSEEQIDLGIERGGRSS